MHAIIIFIVSGIATEDLLVSYKVFGQSFFPVSCNTPRSHCKSKLDQFFFLFRKWQVEPIKLACSLWPSCVFQLVLHVFVKSTLTPSQRRESFLMV